MRILVAGSSGFLGSALCTELRRRGHDVTGGTRSGAGGARLDVADPLSCAEVLASGFDAVINLAATGVTARSSHVDEMTAVNSLGARTLASAVGDLPDPPWYVHVASSTEPSKTQEPESLYSSSKAEGTRESVRVLTARRIPHAIVRVHNTYGPTQPAGRFVHDAVTRLSAGEPIELRHPHRVRDFCWIDDVIEHLADLSTSTASATTAAEIGTGVGTTLIDASRMIAAVCGAPPSLVSDDATDEHDPQLVQVADPLAPGFLLCATGLESGLARMLRVG